MEKKVIRSLNQRYGLMRRQSLALYDEEIKLVFRSGANRSSRTIPLEWIDQNDSEARLYPAWVRWATGITLIAAGAVLAAGLQWGGPWFVVLAGLGGVFLLLAAMFVFRAYDAIYFYNSYNGEFLFAVVKDRPSSEDVGEFMKAMREGMERKKDRAKMESEMPSIATEIHHLAELSRKEIISKEEYLRKKEDLIEDLLRD